MNKQEYYEQHKCTYEYKQVQKLLHVWKVENNITEICVVHHRDDTEEVRKYNNEHYERWGFSEDGTFEYGKYVIFMTNKDHGKYHNAGEKNGFYGKHHSREQRDKWSNDRKGRKLNEQWKQHISENSAHVAGFKGHKHTEEAKQLIAHNVSRALKGRAFTDEHRKAISESKKGKAISEEFKQQLKNTYKAIVYMYNIYKKNGGMLKWNDFRKALSNGNVSFNNETQFSVFINYGGINNE